MATLSINLNFAYRPLPIHRSTVETNETDDAEYDTDLFETVDLLSGLAEDPMFVFESQKPLQRFVMESQARQPMGSFVQASQSSSQLLTLRKHVRETIPVRSGLVVKMRTTNASVTDKMVMMSVELENPPDAGCEFIVEKMDVQVSHAVVSMAFSKETPFPVNLNTSDQMVLLYDVTLLEDGSVKPPTQPQRMFPSRRAAAPAAPHPSHYQDERLQPQRVSIVVHGTPVIDGVAAALMRSKWNTMLDVTGIRQKKEDPNPPDPRFSSLLASSTPSYLTRSTSLSTSVSVSPGARSVGSPVSQITSIDGIAGKKRMVLNMPPAARDHPGARRAPEVEIADGIVVSFTVPDPIYVGKIFPLHIFIVNRSKHTRRFQVMVPNRKRHTPETFNNPTKTILPPLPIDQPPIDPFMDEAENNVRLSPLGPFTSQTVDIRFIAVKEKLHTIDLIQLVDQDTGFVTNLRHVLEIFVEQA
ncbi:hypothetical protein EC973_006425 [Apophysomyces ossiformis]|uniref:Trafficking protein particle complex II-specific subunit 65 IgD3 domain-containing protein n=1 Tax=Apophysomyces ossiformis TaxID=679940 RepID=A0A8H7BXY1_9FUNG|nr:hypothetical protein EC973_006425 [Apophysomyces ossiformis]